MRRLHGWTVYSYALAAAVLFTAEAHAQDSSAPAGMQAQAAGSSPAAEETSAPEGEELQRLEARRRALFQQMLEEPANLDIAFEYAGLSARVGDVEAAIATLERMLIFAPGLPRLQLELGVLYYRLGANETARLYFESALAAPNVPEVVKARVDPYLAAIDERTAGYVFNGVITAGIRYQTNANAAPGGGTINLPGFPGPVELTVTGEPDYNAFATGSFLYSLDLENQGDRFDVNLFTYGAKYDEHDELDTLLGDLKFGPVFDLERFNLENTSFGINGILSGIQLGGDAYLGAVGAGASFATLLGPRTRLSVQNEYRREEYYDSDFRPTASLRSGHRITGTTRLEHQLMERFSIFAAIEGERRMTRRDFSDAWEWGGSAGWVLAMKSPIVKQTEPWTLALVGGYLKRDYDAPDPTINLVEAEEDDEAYVTGTLTVPIRGGWAVQAQGGYRQVTSNYEVRAFENLHGSMAIQKRF